jgi:hypothetical protein
MRDTFDGRARGKSGIAKQGQHRRDKYSQSSTTSSSTIWHSQSEDEEAEVANAAVNGEAQDGTGANIITVDLRSDTSTVSRPVSSSDNPAGTTISPPLVNRSFRTINSPLRVFPIAVYSSD